MKYETAKLKADKYLKLGDSLCKENPSKSRRLLRLCRYYRSLQKKLKGELDNVVERKM